MISQIEKMDNELLDKLKQNHYSRRIKSNFYAYKNKFDFSRFFILEINQKSVGIISIFNSSMIISTFQNRILNESLLQELAEFILINRPATIEFESFYAVFLKNALKEEYKSDVRTEFKFISKNSLPDLEVDELPKLDNVYNVLKTSFPSIANSYELWLTDTSHRVRHGLSQSFLLGNYTTATIQYIIDGTALIGQVATLPEHRGKYYARHLLYWIGERLTIDGFSVRLHARPYRVSYYEEIGFKAIGTDIVLERITD